MKLEKFRIQNFRCIADTGEVPLDDRLTLFIGKNEAGKSAILRALWHFNEENNFEDDADISTLTGIRHPIDQEELSRNDVDIVTLWLTLSEHELLKLGIRSSGTSSQLKITKTLGNQYRAEPLPPPEPDYKAMDTLLKRIDHLTKQLESVYAGKIKRKRITDAFVWLESQPGEDERENLVLFAEGAPEIWDQLKADDWVQVTRVQEDPYGRNKRALNAGVRHDVDAILAALRELKERVGPSGGIAESVEHLLALVKMLPSHHPLRDHLNEEEVAEIARLSEGGMLSTGGPPDLAQRLGSVIEFLYFADLPDLCDSISIKSLEKAPTQPDEHLFAAMTKAVGLQSHTLMQKDIVNRRKVLQDKSTAMSERLGRSWVDDVSCEFELTGQRLGMWMKASGSDDPPSRRSKGLGYYISMFAMLTDLSTRTNVVLLLDDPGVYLHPLAQAEVRKLLDSNPFQVIMATHLPFMIDPERIDRVRVVHRTPEGTRIEEDWSKVRDVVLPIWGSVLGSYSGRAWLIVEGRKDQRAYARMNRMCASTGRKHLPLEVAMVPGGGDQLSFMVEELLRKGIQLVVLLDGDKAGVKGKVRVRKIEAMRQDGVLTLSDFGMELVEPKLETLFSTQAEYQKAISGGKDDPNIREFDQTTLERFEMIFARLNDICEFE